MATGYIVAPISKLPFLNIMTDVLLTQVPVETREKTSDETELSELSPNPHKTAAHWAERYTMLSLRPIFDDLKNNIKLVLVTLTLWKYEYWQLCLVIDMIL